jgi:hypothetical protein
VTAPATSNTFYIPASSGANASTPDSAGNSIVGDIDIRVRVAMADWTPGAGSSTFLAKYAASPQRSYWFYMSSTNFLGLRWSATGVTQLQQQATANTSFVDGSVHWIRVTLDVDNGAIQHEVKFWKSDDATNDPTAVTWTQLGATVTTAGVTSIFNSTTPVRVGANDASTGAPPTDLSVYYAEVRNGIGGTVAQSFDATAVTRIGTRDPASVAAGGPWTMNGATWDWVAA